jgi:hypothetical protein
MWFDDYIPTAFRRYGAKTSGAKGHRFGRNLSAEDKQALIAFLKTL